MKLILDYPKFLAQAAFVYDFERGKDKFWGFFPDIDQIFEYKNTTDRAFAYSIKKVLYIVNMGTSGKDFSEIVAAWKENFKTKPVVHGIPEGFYVSARNTINHFAHYFDYEAFELICIIGHSRASSLSSAEVSILIDDKIKHPNFLTIGFAGPPDGNFETDIFYNEHRDRWEAWKVINPPDIVTQIMRNNSDKYHRGIDIGNKLYLPPDSRWQKTLLRLFTRYKSAKEHSPKEYNDGTQMAYRMWCKDNIKKSSALDLLRRSRKEMVN